VPTGTATQNGPIDQIGAGWEVESQEKGSLAAKGGRTDPEPRTKGLQKPLKHCDWEKNALKRQKGKIPWQKRGTRGQRGGGGVHGTGRPKFPRGGGGNTALCKAKQKAAVVGERRGGGRGGETTPRSLCKNRELVRKGQQEACSRD